MIIVKARDVYMTITTSIAFEDLTLAELASMPDALRDELPFGVIGMDRDNVARLYNETESTMAGLSPGAVLGLPFFEAVAQCMNNALVAGRFEDAPELDETIPFVLTLRMRPTRVRLRLLASGSEPMRFILIER